MTSGNSNYITAVGKPFDTTSLTFRVDHQLNDRDRLFFTSIIGDQNLQNESPLPYTGERKYTSNSLYSLNWQHAFNANLFNEFRLGYAHAYFNNGAENSAFDLQTEAGFQNVPNEPNVWSVPVISMIW